MWFDLLDIDAVCVCACVWDVVVYIFCLSFSSVRISCLVLHRRKHENKCRHYCVGLLNFMWQKYIVFVYIEYLSASSDIPKHTIYSLHNPLISNSLCNVQCMYSRLCLIVLRRTCLSTCVHFTVTFPLNTPPNLYSSISETNFPETNKWVTIARRSGVFSFKEWKQFSRNCKSNRVVVNVNTYIRYLSIYTFQAYFRV